MGVKMTDLYVQSFWKRQCLTIAIEEGRYTNPYLKLFYKKI